LKTAIQTKSIDNICVYPPPDGICALKNQWERAFAMEVNGARQTCEAAAYDQNSLIAAFHSLTMLAAVNVWFV
jgi:hypothetical protein